MAWQRRTGGRDGAQSRAEDSDWQQSETGGDDGLERLLMPRK